MINIHFTCPVCGKTWVQPIDEHDIERYLPGKQYPNVRHFCCSGDTKPAYGDFEMEQPCNECLDM